MEMRELI